MSNKYSAFVWVLAIWTISASVPAQDNAQQNSQDATSDKAADTAVVLSTLVRAWQPLQSSDQYMVPFYNVYNDMLAAEDGQYLAHNKTELQTYYDLGMSYHYISKPFFRQQLKLPAEQGIVIESADPTKIGHRVGFRDGDIVLTIDDTAVDTQYDLVIALSEQRGHERKATVLRQGSPQDLVVTLPILAVEPEKRFVIGVSVEEPSEALKAQLQVNGVVINSLVDDGPAQAAGMQIHDLVTSVNETAVENIDQLRAAVQASQGNPVKLQLVRAAKNMVITVTPVESSDEAAAIADPNLPLTDLPLLASFYVMPDRRAFQFIDAAKGVALAAGQTSDDNAQSLDARVDALIEQIAKIQQQLQELKASRDQ